MVEIDELGIYVEIRKALLTKHVVFCSSYYRKSSKISVGREKRGYSENKRSNQETLDVVLGSGGSSEFVTVKSRYL